MMDAKWTMAAIGLFAMAAAPQAAAAANAYTTTEVNMRAGPSTGFPRVTTLPAGAAVSIYGCTSAWSWCDTSWRGLRGWVSGRYLQALYDGRRVVVPEQGRSIGLPVITFEIGTYWDRWYRDRPWYEDRDRWDGEWESYSGRAPQIRLEIAPEARGSSDRVPPGIRKKGPGFCPPGLQRQGRCP